MPDPSKTYNPKEVEEKWLKIWFENKIFKTKIDPNKKSFSISLPPPNITGNLHMGHALNAVMFCTPIFCANIFMFLYDNCSWFA